MPEQIVAGATRTDLRHGTRMVERAATTSEVPELGSALVAGQVSGPHVDAVGAALRRLQPGQRERLAARGQQLAGIAARTTADEFRRHLAREVRSIEADDGRSRLERQRAQVRLRSWTDLDSGMV